MKKILFIITIGMLTAQGCTVSIGPTVAHGTHAHTHVASSSTSGIEHPGVVGPEGIRGVEGAAGAESPPAQLMGRSSAVVAPQNAHAHAKTAASKPESFGGKFWENITSNVVNIAAPVILQKLLSN